MKISHDFDTNIAILEEAITDCPDYIIHTLKMKDGTRFLIFYIDNMVASDTLVIRMLPWLLECTADSFDTARLPFNEVVDTPTLDDAMNGVATGGIFFLVEGHTSGFQARIEKLVGRTPEASETEKNIRGPRDSFVENLRINMAILRTRIANHDLKFKSYQLGTTTHQNVAVAYMDRLADRKLLAEIDRRLKKLDYDGYLCTSYVEQMIADDTHSPFPQCNATERVDKAEAALLEGRFLIFVQGAPNALILPVSFFGFFQAMDDFTQPPLVGSIIGVFRVLGLLIAVFFPASYVAVLSFHYYVIPLDLLSALTESRAGVLFSPLGEAILMEVLFEIIREASIRLPSSIGGTIGIVGGIIIGETAIQSGLVSNLMVIVVAVTAIASFVLPSHDLSTPLRFTRFFLMLFAGFFGFIGMAIGAMLLLIHLLQLRSLGQPYLQPALPFHAKDWANTIIRMSFGVLRRRPDVAKPRDKTRGSKNGS